jgi:RimJ/RimL family protein N-acetyltransferase
MNHFIFKQMKNEDIPIYTNEIFSILANNMREIAPTGNTYEEDYKIWLNCAVPAWCEGKCSVILIFDGDILCGYFQYSFSGTTFRMEEIQFKPKYQGSGLFAELYHHLTTIIPADTKNVEAFANKENIKSQAILKHLGLINIGENKNGRSFHFKGEYKSLSERYSQKYNSGLSR